MEGLIPTSDDGKSDVPREHLMKIIIMAIMWSLGAILELADRKKVSRQKPLVKYLMSKLPRYVEVMLSIVLDHVNHETEILRIDSIGGELMYM